MNKSFGSIVYVGLLLAVVPCAYSSANEYSGYSSGEFVDDFTLDDYREAERGVYRENTKYKEGIRSRNSRALKKIVQKHNGTSFSPNVHGGRENRHVTDIPEKTCIQITNKQTSRRRQAIVAIPVVDYDDCFKQTQELLKRRVDSILGENAFRMKENITVGGHRRFHATLLYTGKSQEAEMFVVKAAMDKAAKKIGDKIKMKVEGPVRFFGTRQHVGKRFLGLSARIDDNRISQLVNGIVQKLPDDYKAVCRKSEEIHITLGHVQIQNDQDAQKLETLINSNIPCNRYVHGITRVQCMIPGISAIIESQFAPNYAERKAQKAAARLAAVVGLPTQNPVTPNPVTPSSVADDADWPEAMYRWARPLDEELDESDVPENWYDGLSDDEDSGAASFLSN